ncbi:hypothetical protein BDY19DRAFT_365463 [Irpex rosettiformis]|uniref:Uncharacterized protein n=1 Tax=Irpex rosettiformis TaxID=378272 RepID=A0ACB8TW12_9APHY|nr:hypothetical protein BDY19DRAFT_365463 [Irpex rosettiformis]
MAEPTAKNLNESRAEALSAILQTLSSNTAAEATTNDDGNKLSTDQVQKLSEKLGQILGDQAEDGEPSTRNEKVELINEEGLPIVDINEPVTATDITFRPDPDGHFDDPDLLPAWALSPAEQARRRSERERILDLLEEEERLQERQDVEAARERMQKEMEKRKEAAKTEMDNLKRARELQKKMGRALIRSVVESRDKEEKEKAELAEKDKLTTENKVPKTKKSVSFADDIDEDGRIKSNEKEENIEWGDVVPGTLRTSGKTLSERQDRQPMKLHVVERHPRCLSQTAYQPPEQDSDDESDPESTADAAEDSGSDNGFLGADNQSPNSEESDEDLPADERMSDWNGDDFDYAQHQREVALEYYNKRQAMGIEASSAMRAHTHDENEWDQPDVPLEATLASGPPKPSVSRFRAERASHAGLSQSTLASHSLGASVVPSSSVSSMKRAVRMGKLENGKLVGGDDGESEDEALASDENAREMLELLRKGEVTNIGPESFSARIIPPTPITTSAPEFIPSSPSTSEKPPSESTQPPQQAKPSKVSKFKLSLAQSEMKQPSSLCTASGDKTPTNPADRSSPKMTSPRGGTPVRTNTPSCSSQSSSSQPPRFTLPPELQAAFQNGEIPVGMPSMIVESPSFRPTSGSVSSPLSGVSPTSTIVATPTSATSSCPPVVAGVVREGSTVSTPMRETVLERRPPTIVSSRAQSDLVEAKPKLSRFKAQRS